MKRWKLYNKSSESMSEVVDSSVDLIISSVPFNIGTVYDEVPDLKPFKEYKQFLQNVIRECYRVINDSGVMVLEVTDAAMMNRKFVLLSAFIQNICSEIGFQLIDRHINFALTNDNKQECQIRTIGHDFIATGDHAYSNCCQWLVFTKHGEFQGKGQIHYLNYYGDVSEHPCTFPDKMCRFFIEEFFKPENTVLDPFAGVATFGVEVVKAGGQYIGYELSKSYFEIAQKKLQGESSC